MTILSRYVILIVYSMLSIVCNKEGYSMSLVDWDDKYSSMTAEEEQEWFEEQQELENSSENDE